MESKPVTPKTEDTNSAIIEENALAAPAPRRSPAKPRTKTRSIEELRNISVKDMSPKELEKTIAYLQEQLKQATNKLCALEDNIRSAYQSKNELEHHYQAELQQLEGRINFMKQTTRIFSKTIIDLS